MRVITGSARGMSLKTLEGLTTRPTSEKVKEAVFSALQFEIEGRRVLDLFAGSGQLGIEALSRGAESAVFVDSDKNAAAVIKENVTKTKFTEKSHIVHMDSFSFLRMNVKKFDIVFLDPPYAAGVLDRALEQVSDFIAPGGVAVCEYPSENQPPKLPEGLSEHKIYKYSRTSVAIYRKD